MRRDGRSATPNTIAKPRKTKRKKIPTRAYGYVRVSTEEQAQEGISLDMQREKIQAYASLHDLELVEIFSDEGASGKDLERPALTELLEHLAGHEAEALIVYKLDRLTRNVRELLYLVDEVFKQGNTRLLSLTEHIDTKSAMGKFFLVIMGGLAEMERNLISERTRAALEQKKLRGERVGGTPLGFRTGEDGELVPVAAELEIVKLVKRLRRSGKGFREIARVLNRREIPTKRGGRWHDSTVRYLLRNKRYRGM